MKAGLVAFHLIVAVTAIGATAVVGHAQSTDDKSTAEAEYMARLQPMNTAISETETTGEARLTVAGDELTINVDVKNAPAGMTHWQHFHGFEDDSEAACPTEAADVNGDGIIDLLETEPAAGTTMVPFDNDPAAMDVAHGTYPEAATDGDYSYQKVVSMEALSEAFAEAFEGSELDLERRVIFIHGVPEDTSLPESVASLGPIPAHVTLPIACGEIERIR